MFWPRGEPKTPSTTRVYPTSRHILSSSCSSFRVDWAWEDGTDPFLNFHNKGDSLSRGVQNFQLGDVWNPRPSTQSIGDTVEPSGLKIFRTSLAILEAALLPVLTGECDGEQSFVLPQLKAAPYKMVFQYWASKIQIVSLCTKPFLDPIPASHFLSLTTRGGSQPRWLYELDASDIRQDWTPWPAALRITATIHDRLGRLQAGQTTQFIVPLPQRDTAE